MSNTSKSKAKSAIARESGKAPSNAKPGVGLNAPTVRHVAEKQPDSKELVLNAAQTLIMEHGFTGLSMRELARHAGIAKGTIYHHFQDKCDIYLSVLERDITITRDRLFEVLGSPPPDTGNRTVWSIRAFVQVYFQLQRERRLVILSALRENSVLDEKFSEILKKYQTELLQPIGEILRKGIDRGEVRPVNVELAVMSLFGILQGYVIHQLILADTDIDNAVEEHIVDLFFQGIGACQGLERPETHLAQVDRQPTEE